MSQRIAIVGGGIAGLTAAWYLSRDHQVTLFEAEPRLGGHTFTVDVQREHGDGHRHPHSGEGGGPGGRGAPTARSKSAGASPRTCAQTKKLNSFSG